MHRTEGANNDGNLFKDGPPGTTVGAAILNAVQEEICNVIEKSGIALKTQGTETRDQLAKAISDFVDKTKYGVDNEATDAYIITRSPAPSVLYDGMMVSFKANTANTGAATLNDTSLGAKAIRKGYNQALQTGDISAGQIITVRYDITNDWYQVQTGLVAISDTIYGAGWNGITTVAPSKNAVYDEMTKKAAKGANADITSLAGLTTPLSIAQGGSGTVGDSIIKAWIQFNGTGVIAINDSFNVSGIVDNNVGDYSVAWDTDFANASYSVVGNASKEAARERIVTWTGLITTGVQMTVEGGGGGGVDVPKVCIMAIGDPA